MIAIVAETFLPNKVILLAEENLVEDMRMRLPFLESMKMIEKKATAYVCKDYTCQCPTNKPDELQKQLAGDSLL